MIDIIIIIGLSLSVALILGEFTSLVLWVILFSFDVLTYE
jgi:hypothetical protein